MYDDCAKKTDDDNGSSDENSVELSVGMRFHKWQPRAYI
jgi:hypothetical protein